MQDARKKRRGRQKKRRQDNVKELTEMEFASSFRAVDTGQYEKGLLRVIFGAPTTLQGYGIY